MRVLVVTNIYPTETMPAFGIYVYEQVQSLRRKGLDVDVLFINGKANTWNYALGAWQVLRQVRTAAYDIVHAHYVFSGILARLQFRYPLVVTFHGAGEMAGWVGWLCRVLAPWVDAFTVTSVEHAAQLGHPGARIVPCGIDLELFRPMPMREARQRLKLAEDKKLVLFAADLRPEKRIDVARAAIALLQQEDASVELVVVSGRPHEEIPLFMNACDVLVLTSDYEGSPQVIKEAMACNLPIVSVDVGDVAEVIGNTEGCFLCQRTPEDVADKLRRALTWGRRTGGRSAVEHLSLDRIADRIISIYHQVLAKRGRTPMRDSR